MENIKSMEKKIYITKDYSIFKELKGNRDVADSRVDKIINSIREIGYVTNPIIVNEKMEIIDGQGRFKALKELKMPIEYIIEEGTGIEHCLKMNINQTNWNLNDYIKSYAANGRDGYSKLLDLIEKYPQYNCYVLLTATREVSKVDGSYIKNGNLTITDEQYNKAIEKLEWLNKFEGLFNNTPGRKYYLQQGLLYCYIFTCVDNDRLLNKMKELAYMIEPYIGITDAIAQIEKIYNKNIKNDYAFITTEYRRSLMSRMRAGTTKMNYNK